VLVDGGVRCWGQNLYGEVGIPPDGGPGVSAPVSVVIPGPVNTVMASNISCATRTGSLIRCWGPNVAGELGADAGSGWTPTDLYLSPATVAKLVGGPLHSCALMTNGDVFCWGLNTWGNVGMTDGGTGSSDPVRVSLSGAIDLSAGATHNCAVMGDGGIQCWGGNNNGELGRASTMPSKDPIPAPVMLQGSVAREVVTGSIFSCALISDGTAKCWGNNSYGETGSSIGGVFPSPVQGLTGIAHLAAGDSFACALLDTNELRCWGNNTYFQLSGNGFSGSTKINPGLTDVRQLSAGQDYACARLGDGGVSCWGRNQGGQLGNGFIGTNSMTPQSVTGL
jgi:alpha-tubulin suppressor-like RCC1 family protein